MTGSLHLTRGTQFSCLINLDAEPVTLPQNASVLLTSGPLDAGRIPTDTAVGCNTIASSGNTRAMCVVERK